MSSNIKAYWHQYFRRYPFVIVDDLNEWANGHVTASTFFQKVKVKSTRYVVIERAGAIGAYGNLDDAEISATLAMVMGHDKWPMNPNLALRHAIEETIRAEDEDAFNILKKIYEDNIGVCPYSMDENISTNMYVPHEMHKGEVEDEDEYEKIRDMMDDEIEAGNGFVDEGTINELVTSDGSSPFSSTPSYDKPKTRRPSKKPKASKPAQGEKKTTKTADTPQAKLKAQGYKSIRGYGSFWSRSGKLPAEMKIEDGKIKKVAPKDQPNAKAGAKTEPTQPQAGVKTPAAKKARTVKVVDKGSDEHKKAVADARDKKSKEDAEIRAAKGEPEPKKEVGKNEGQQIVMGKPEIAAIDKAIGDIKKSKNKASELKEVIKILEAAKESGQLSKAEAEYVGKFIRPTESGKKTYLTLSEKPGNPMEDFGKKGPRRNYEKIGAGKFAQMLQQLGVPDAVTTFTGQSKMKPEKIFTDKDGKLRTTEIQTGQRRTGVLVNGRELKTRKMPDPKKFLEYYKKQGLSDEEAKTQVENITRAMAKYNKGVEFFQKALKESGESKLETVDVIPGVHPTTAENRRKLADKALDDTMIRMGELTSGQGKEQLIAGLAKLKKANAENFDEIMNEVLHPIMTDEILKDGGADLVEIVSYVRALTQGYEAYMPSAGNWPLGDVVILPGEDTPLKTVEDIATHIDMISVSLENQSVKKDAGAASALKDKIEQSVFSDPSAQEDLRICDGAIYDSIWNTNDPKKATTELTKLYKKYKLDPKKVLAEGAKTIKSVHAMVLKANPKIDKKEYLEQLQLEYLNGMLAQHIYNTHLDTQFFSNEKYKVLTNDLKLDRSNGVTRLAYMKFRFNNKFSASGKPDTRIAGEMVNKDRGDF